MSARSYQDLDHSTGRALQGTDAQSAPWWDQIQPRGNAFVQEQMREQEPDGAGGLLTGPVRMAISACFGDEADEIEVTAADPGLGRGLGADALTLGEQVMVAPNVNLASMNPEAMEILGHEFAHAMAGGATNPTSLVDRRGDPGERQADQAGVRFRRFVEGGLVGEPPKIQAATGGQALIHRHESFEHKEAVDGACATLRDSGRPHGEAVDEGVEALIAQEIHLTNGCTLTAGQVTALMGDFYGVYGPDGVFDPQASFEQLDRAPKEEMDELLAAINREAAGETIGSGEWDRITDNRYGQLALHNSNHFSGRTMEGLDNNMGTYSAFHQMALDAAAAGDDDTARAYEACSMHYLTDRHAAGHQFDQTELQNYAGINSENLVAMTDVKFVHDALNRMGVPVYNADGDIWMTYGDGHMNEPENYEGRQRMAESVYTSYAELQDAIHHDGTASEEHFGAFDTVPQFNQNTQDCANDAARAAQSQSIYPMLADPEFLVNTVLSEVAWKLEDMTQESDQARLPTVMPGMHHSPVVY